MRILNIGLGLFVQELRTLKHEVIALCPGRTGDTPLDFNIDFFQNPELAREIISSWVEKFNPDLIFLVDNSTPLIHLGLEEFSIPKIWFAIDSHLHSHWHKHYAPIFDWVFCAQSNQVSGLQSFQPNVFWLPLCFSLSLEFIPWVERKFELSFIGFINADLNPQRASLINQIQDHGLVIHGFEGNAPQTYQQSRIVFNQSVADDLNFRFFEAMGCGALLITDSLSHSHNEIGEIGRDYLVYEAGNAKDLIQKIHWAQVHPQAAEAIARSGQALVQNKHLTKYRVEKIFEIINRDVKENLSSININHDEQWGHLAFVHEYNSRLELPYTLCDFFASKATRLAKSCRKPSAWALLTLAQLDLTANRFADGLKHLQDLEIFPTDNDFQRTLWLLKTLLLAHSGKFTEALSSSSLGLQIFPRDNEFLRLQKILERIPKI